MWSGFAQSAPKTTLPQRDAEFDALTPEEKEIVYRDLYGTGNYLIEENDGLIQNALDLFEQHLSEISDDVKRCYLLALERSSDYVKDNAFRLQFIRCELFDPKSAAIRFVRYWDEKVKLWGEEKAFHKITLDDFDEDDILAFQKGTVYGIREGDKFGRGIIIFNKSRFDDRHPNSTPRAMWYIMEYLVESVDVQRYGLVAIAGLLPATLKNENRKRDSRLANLGRFALPIRCVAIHDIVPGRFVEFIIPYILFLVGSELRFRYKIHSDRRSAFQVLEAYGIPKKIIPKGLGGDDKAFDFSQWLDERKRTERAHRDLQQRV